jgi:hypothetical protein
VLPLPATDVWLVGAFHNALSFREVPRLTRPGAKYRRGFRRGELSTGTAVVAGAESAAPAL